MKKSVFVLAAALVLSPANIAAQSQSEKIHPRWEGNGTLPAPYITFENGRLQLFVTNIFPAAADIDIEIPIDSLRMKKGVFRLSDDEGTDYIAFEHDNVLWLRVPGDTTGAGTGTVYRYTMFDPEEVPLDTTYMQYPADRTMKVHPRHDYSHTLVTKLFLSQAKFDDTFKHADNGRQDVFLTFEQALERIKALDNITLGMPKIAYLVGWQYNGHDSRYPAFFEGNEALKRPGDANANESIRWLMEEGKKYHTSVSFHINMLDCYEDSPLFLKYLRSDVLARNWNGFLRNSDWGYKVDPVQEWNSGLARERIDSICNIFPIREAGTIHIDAFHTGCPVPVQTADGSFYIRFEKEMSPYHGWTYEDEVAAEIEIIKYWDSKGVDVTTEGVDVSIDGVVDPFERYRPMVWHHYFEHFFRYPPQMLSGGDTGGEAARLFGQSTSLESILKDKDCDFAELTRLFCTSSLITDYLNCFERIRYIHSVVYGKCEYSDGLYTELDGGRFIVSHNGVILAEDDDIFIPALWMEGKNLVAYSSKGYRNKVWNLLPSFPATGTVTIYSIDENGRHPIGKKSYSNRKLRLSVDEGRMLLISFN